MIDRCNGGFFNNDNNRHNNDENLNRNNPDKRNNNIAFRCGGVPSPQHSLMRSHGNAWLCQAAQQTQRVCGVKRFFEPEFRSSRRTGECSVACVYRACLKGVQINHPGRPCFCGRPKSEVPRPSLVAPEGMSVIGGDFFMQTKANFMRHMRGAAEFLPPTPSFRRALRFCPTLNASAMTAQCTLAPD